MVIVILMIVLLIYGVNLTYKSNYAKRYAIFYSFGMSVIFGIITVFLVSLFHYNTKYVGDGYSPNINIKTIVLHDNGFICIDSLGNESMIYDDFKITKISQLDSLDCFTISIKYPIVEDYQYKRLLTSDTYPKDSLELHIPNNIKIINISKLKISK